MYLKVFSILAIIQVVFSQGITFQDGQLGVNFGGYNAGVGFGPGGLSASAGTPFGQRAQAGLGGTVDGVAGGLHAGATAGNGVGASAALGGDVNQGFGAGQAEAHAGGVSKSVVKTVSTNVATEIDSTQTYQTPNVQTVATQAPVIYAQQAPVVTDTQLNPSEAPYSPAQTKPMVGNANYLPPVNAAGSSDLDEDDNDLSHNVVPQSETQTQTQTVVQASKPNQQHVVVTQPQSINVQKIKVKTRPRPIPSYTIVQKQVQVPTYVKTVQYPAAPVQITQYAIPEYQPVVFQKRIHFNTVPVHKVVVDQRIEEVATTEGPTTTTTSTTPRPPYVYTYDKTKVINEIFSIPYHILNSVNSLINAKLNGGYQIQKTVTYA